jgi:DNA helicase-2/ATP-dependent DNA helicase PcrA
MMLVAMAEQSALKSAQAIAAALFEVQKSTARRLNLLPAFGSMSAFADTLEGDDRQTLREDMEVLTQEWDHYLRTNVRTKTLAGMMSSMALGNSGQASKDGVALLTVHSAKGLEFEVVFVMGMAEGVFPDYRAKTAKAMQEERRNAFVAVTRSKRLLYLTYPKKRMMPWGDLKYSSPSQFIRNDQS